MGFPGGSSGKEPTCQCRRHRDGVLCLEEGRATYFSILAWRIPWTEKPDGSRRALSWVLKDGESLMQNSVLKLHAKKATSKDVLLPLVAFSLPPSLTSDSIWKGSEMRRVLLASTSHDVLETYPGIPLLPVLVIPFFPNKMLLYVCL